nr:sphingosine n-acyltransferase lag1 [Quercus suber]
MRHFINLRILSSLLPETPYIAHSGEFTQIGPFELNWDTQQYKCWISQGITFALLAILQAVNIFWFVLIVRVLYRILFQGVKKDERSDDEEEVEEEVEEAEEAEKSGAPRGGAVLLSQPEVRLNGQPTNYATAVTTGIDGPAVQNVAPRTKR